MEENKSDTRNPSNGAPQNTGQRNVDNKKGVKSLVFGILGLVLFWLPLVGLVLGITAIIYFVKQNKVGKSDMAIGGLILGILGIIGNFFLLPVILIVAFGNWFTSFQGNIQSDAESWAQAESMIVTKITNEDIWINNRGRESISNVKVEVDNVDCTPTPIAKVNIGIRRYDHSCNTLKEGQRIGIYAHSTSSSAQNMKTLIVS